MLVEIWSDVVCPWCAIGKRRFEAALARFPQRDDVDVRWRSFELDPGAPPLRTGAYAERLAAKYGVGVGEAQDMIARMTAAAASEGLDFHFERMRPGNTFDAHRLLHLAAAHGRQDELKERLLLAYHSEGEAIGTRDVLQRAAVEVGLPAGEVASVLDGDRYAEDVRTDEREARALGISAVPFFVLDRRYGVSGAQPADVLLDALRRAFAAREPLTVASGDGEACGADGCAI